MVSDMISLNRSLKVSLNIRQGLVAASQPSTKTGLFKNHREKVELLQKVWHTAYLFFLYNINLSQRLEENLFSNLKLKDD